MGELGAFLKIHRVGFDKRDPRRRVHDYEQYFGLQPEAELRRQGARCMDCGVPFCHEGCPLGNLIPDWNDLVYRDKWREAIDQLHATNNFPEFTGLICPAPCESACVLAINDDPVTIEQIELAIVERAFDEGWIVPEPPDRRSGRTVAVVGAGPAGLAVAAELNRCGHAVTVYERDEGPGGLMRFGVPDAKLEKWIIDRRVDDPRAGGHRVRLRHRRRPRRDRRGARRSASTRSSISIGSPRLARPRRARPRARRDPLRDGLPLPAQSLGRRRSRARPIAAPGAGHRDQRPRQEGDRDRRRRHRHGLHLELPPRGRARASSCSTSTRSCPTARTRGTPWPLPPKRTASTYALEEGGKRRWGTEVTGFGGKDGSVSHVYARQVTGTSSRDLTPGARLASSCSRPISS